MESGYIQNETYSNFLQDQALKIHPNYPTNSPLERACRKCEDKLTSFGFSVYCEVKRTFARILATQIDGHEIGDAELLEEWNNFDAILKLRFREKIAYRLLHNSSFIDPDAIYEPSNALFPRKIEWNIVQNDGWVTSYVNLELPEWDLPQMIDPDTIVAPAYLYFLLNYPLSCTVYYLVKSSSPEGFKRDEIVAKVAKVYQQIYKEEEETSSITPMSHTDATKGKVVLANRIDTDGKYGIWGHVLGDLRLRAIETTPESRKGLPVYKLIIDP